MNNSLLRLLKRRHGVMALTGVSLALMTAVSMHSTPVRAQEAEPQPPEMEMQETEPMQQPAQESEPLTEDEQNVTREELINRAEDFVGQTVTIRGEMVEEQPTGDLFRIANEGLFGTEEILVIGATMIPEVPEQAVDLQVTGEVRRFVVDDVIGEFGFNTPDEFYEAYGEDYADYEGQPAIFAQSIALSPTPDQVGSNPESFYGQTVAIQGEISTIASDTIFTIQGNGLFGSNLLAVNLNSLPIPEEGEDVVVTGTIRQLSEAQQEYEYLQDAQTQAGVGYEEGPVLYVDGIYPSAE